MADQFQLKALITGVDKLSPTLAGIRKNVSRFRKGLQNTGLGNLSFKDVIAGGALAAPFVMGTRAAIQFESAMADVRKVVNFDAPSQFKEMGDDITKMSERLPMAANDIAKIVAAGGQSGIARGELLGFAEDAVKMGIAFDQTAEQSGDMMAKWRTSFKMTQAEVVGLADKINYLGNTGPANTKQISDIVTRVGPLGEVAGVASGQIAAMGATMAGVGVEQEVAATGIKNFMLALTKGSAATKSQATAFQALRLDSKAVAAGMQKDAQATMVGVLKRIAAVDATKRPALLSNLFGTESIGAIAPLLTNLGLLESNLRKTGDAEQYAGSMEAEYASRSATTENTLTLMRNAVNRAGIALGNAFLPALNAVVTAVQPLISRVSDFIQANPALVRGLAVAGVAFTAVRVAVLGAMVATRLLGLAFAATPIGIAAVAIAAAAGLIVANWDRLAPYFEQLWQRIQGPAMTVWGWMKEAFSWTPLGLIIDNWQPIGTFFSALWDLIKAYSVPFSDFLKTLFDWSPVGLIIKHWEPIVGVFKGIWDRVKPFLEPIMKFLNLGNAPDIGVNLTAKVGELAAAQNQLNAGVGGGTGAFLRSDAVRAAAIRQEQMKRVAGVGSNEWLLRTHTGPLPGAFVKRDSANDAIAGSTGSAQEARRLAAAVSQAATPLAAPRGLAPVSSLTVPSASASSGVLPAPGSLLTRGGGATKLNGELVIRLEGDTRGVRPQPATTDQPGLKVSTNVGYRSLSGAQ